MSAGNQAGGRSDLIYNSNFDIVTSNDLSVLLSRKQRRTNRSFHRHVSPIITDKRPGTRSMNSSKLNELDAWEVARLMAKRELRAVDLLHTCLDRIAERDDEVHAFAHLDRAHALVQAHALDNGPVRGLLHGLPIGVKDLFDTVDFPTGYGSPIYGAHRPIADAASVALCREAGALVMGKTVTTEFAYFYPGATRNPHDLT